MQTSIDKTKHKILQSIYIITWFTKDLEIKGTRKLAFLLSVVENGKKEPKKDEGISFTKDVPISPKMQFEDVSLGVLQTAREM